MKKNNEILGFLRDLQVKFPRFYTRVLTARDLTLPQYTLLSLLTISGTVPMTEISEKLFISKPAVTSLVDRLEEKKFLKRLPHPNDRRVHLIQIAPKGEKLTQAIRASALALFLKTLDKFSANEREIIGRFYASLSHTMDTALRGKR